MKFVTVRDIRTSPATIWKQLPKEQEMIITNNGKPIALLTPLSDTDLEGTLKAIRRARAQQALTALQEESSQAGRSTMSLEEINAEIQSTRQAM
jgi:antitoxin (DNA-binding transcriptional repressor) of toxin-antitoxin stability system